MSESYVVYGRPGFGSVPVEAALTLIGARYRVEEGPTWTGATAPAGLAKINPMRQVPALILPSGELMTESAAILIWLADAHPAAGLSPPLESPNRPAFLRWMVFASAAIYALYWIRDDPARLVADKLRAAEVKARTAERIASCWAVMESQTSPDPYLLGDDLSVLDLYVTVLSRWGPRRKAFYEAAPRMGDVVRRVDADPRLAGFWAERFAFVDGWEG
jgi:GST-like protein